VGEKFHLLPDDPAIAGMPWFVKEALYILALDEAAASIPTQSGSTVRAPDRIRKHPGLYERWIRDQRASALARSRQGADRAGRGH